MAVSAPSGQARTMLRCLGLRSDASGMTNEDAVGMTDHAAWVLDGATGLTDVSLTNAPSDARWLVDGIDAAFRSAFTDEEADLREVVRDTMTSMARAFETVRWRNVSERYELPSAAMAVVRLRGASLELASLGDCRVLVYRSEGEFVDFTNNRIGVFDTMAVDEMKALHAAGTTAYGEVRQRLLPTLRRHRMLHNVPEGYWVLGLDGDPAGHLRHAVVPFGPDDVAMLVSDGFYHLVDHFERFNPEELVTEAVGRGLPSLLEELRSLEHADPDCVRFPRLKPSDDASVVLVTRAQ